MKYTQGGIAERNETARKGVDYALWFCQVVDLFTEQALFIHFDIDEFSQSIFGRQGQILTGHKRGTVWHSKPTSLSVTSAEQRQNTRPSDAIA
ncbi:unnamed protein product [Soboliphyme baturini]|uniref:Transposase n=1 Tax=Soboliphyme baturini TaxID=241478 RepID=A0A183J5B8_9BILA|nr:unnamed protein product [Soboliphyme baturini]